jgi:hypothetical protein
MALIAKLSISKATPCPLPTQSGHSRVNRAASPRGAAVGDAMSDWLTVYLVGCAVAVLFWLVDVALFSALDWILKGGVLRKNLRKLDAPDTETFWTKFWVHAVLLLLSFALSWIQVLISLFSILWRLMKIVREAFVTVPEDIKQLRFPLYNNPEMSREAVWAYTRALQAKAGGNLATVSELLGSLQSVIDNCKHFDARGALKHLRELNAVSAEAIDVAIKRIDAERDG